MGEKDFKKFMQTLLRILEITGDTVLCFNRVAEDGILVGPKDTAPCNVSYQHQNPGLLKVCEGISVNVEHLTTDDFEQVLKNAYEQNEFRFDYPDEVLDKLKPEDGTISSPKFQEFINKLKDALNKIEGPTFFVTREGERHITLHVAQPENKTLITPGELGIKEIRDSQSAMELDRWVVTHSVFQEHIHHFWVSGVVKVPFMVNKLTQEPATPKKKSDIDNTTVEDFDAINNAQGDDESGFKLSAHQVHRVVAFFSPGTSLEEVQKLIEIVKLGEVHK